MERAVARRPSCPLFLSPKMPALVVRIRPGQPRLVRAIFWTPRMPHCTVRYHVRLIPKIPDANPMSAIGIFYEERMPDAVGEPGPLISRRLDTFSGPTGPALREMVTIGNAWDMDVRERVGPLEWDQ